MARGQGQGQATMTRTRTRKAASTGATPTAKNGARSAPIKATNASRGLTTWFFGLCETMGILAGSKYNRANEEQREAYRLEIARELAVHMGKRKAPARASMATGGASA